MSIPRLFHPSSLAALQQAGVVFSLSDAAARHVQVLRLQPSYEITLFDGQGGEYRAHIQAMTKQGVSARVLSHTDIEREVAAHVALAICCPANERMDWLVEKATELGVREIYPLLSERVVLRLSGERAEKRRVHWHSIALAACEQSGRNRVPLIHPLMKLNDFLTAANAPTKLVLSLGEQTRDLSSLLANSKPIESVVLCGPEGGLSPLEETAAMDAGFAPVSLANRVLRSETAALAVLTILVS